MPWIAVIGLVCFVLGFVGLCAVIVSGWADDRAAPTPERPSRTVRVIRDPRFDLERHDHDWRGDPE